MKNRYISKMTLVFLIAFGIVYYAVRNTETLYDGLWVILGYYMFLSLMLVGRYTKEWRNNWIFFGLRIVASFVILYLIAPRMLYYKAHEHFIVLFAICLIEYLSQIKSKKSWRYVLVILSALTLLATVPLKGLSKVDRAVDAYIEVNYPSLKFLIVNQGFPTKEEKASYIIISGLYEASLDEQKYIDIALIYEEGVLREK